MNNAEQTRDDFSEAMYELMSRIWKAIFKKRELSKIKRDPEGKGEKGSDKDKEGKEKEKDIDKKALESINKEELTGKSKKVYEYLEKNPEIAKQVILKFLDENIKMQSKEFKETNNEVIEEIQKLRKEMNMNHEKTNKTLESVNKIEKDLIEQQKEMEDLKRKGKDIKVDEIEEIKEEKKQNSISDEMLKIYKEDSQFYQKHGSPYVYLEKKENEYWSEFEKYNSFDKKIQATQKEMLPKMVALGWNPEKDKEMNIVVFNVETNKKEKLKIDLSNSEYDNDKKVFSLKDSNGKEIDGGIKTIFNQDKYRLIPESFKDHEKNNMKNLEGIKEVYTLSKGSKNQEELEEENPQFRHMNASTKNMDNKFLEFAETGETNWGKKYEKPYESKEENNKGNEKEREEENELEL
ncbi:viral A-type inclusion protein [Bacillus cereus]|uniref:viral A-type inclusion protein n=1 Tax=Bacillus cereus TaxID=1396 RepID=UPI0024061C1F|nr:viral A-type inclusion protein [Bacillus cereus]MDF9524653.1 viral A-type inclusion protein [Bacillus cereus]MDF9564297.1 viral A-type inclusion protein [Bacillus cereus]